ncbi:hypothetical protein IW261DRAFT_1625694 [Armillaria novae-zelandiae]|uniref:FAD-binding PCMH-type domain-containing protein n=1 Tax=Armillaria novae-zelandiae TaxID=153914 RepID=A0AA39NCZ0_9AGAR|nr:hypothetical protein IW261DRAFT_1625694 [Armillaria novae-zelandiae]
MGTCPYIGISGHIAGGGFRFASGMWGLTLDTVQSMNVVLANATIVTASGTPNTDLFWVSMRGAASSFGIITSINVKTFVTSFFTTIFEYDWRLDYSTAAAALSKFQVFMLTDIPSELGVEINIGRGNSKGTVYFGWTALIPWASVRYSSNRAHISTVEALDSSVVDTKVAGPDSTDAFYAKSLMMPEGQPMTLDIDSIHKTMLRIWFAWFMQFDLYGGGNSAINLVNVDSTVFSTRSALFTMQIMHCHTLKLVSPSWMMPLAITVIMGASWDYGAYVNYPDDCLNSHTLMNLNFHGNGKPKLKE